MPGSAISTTLLVTPSSYGLPSSRVLSPQDGAPVAAACQNVLDTHGLKDVEAPEGVDPLQPGNEETGWVWSWHLLQLMTAEQELSAEQDERLVAEALRTGETSTRVTSGETVRLKDQGLGVER